MPKMGRNSCKGNYETHCMSKSCKKYHFSGAHQKRPIIACIVNHDGAGISPVLGDWSQDEFKTRTKTTLMLNVSESEWYQKTTIPGLPHQRVLDSMPLLLQLVTSFGLI